MSTNVCTKCNDPIESEGVKVGNDAYHANCFLCSKCKQPFEEKFVTVGEERFHEECRPANVELMGDSFLDIRICAGCESPLEDGGFVEAGEKFYHTNCFKCYVCRQLITEGAFEAHSGKGVCHERCAPTQSCDICRETIETSALIVEGRHIHSDCFRCVACGKTIENGSFSSIDNAFYHASKACIPADAGFLDLCPICNETMCQPAVQVEGKRMHRACFRCNRCGNSFSGDEFAKDEENQYIHTECAQ